MADPGAPTLTARQPRAIHSALTVLEAVAELGPGVSAQEVSAFLGLPRATTYRLLNLLVQDEYLVRTPDLSGFALGTKVAQLAAAAAPPVLPSAARQLIGAVRGEVRGGVHVVRFERSRVIVVDGDPDFPLSDAVRLSREPERYAIGRLLLVAGGGTGVALDAAAADFARWGATRQLDELAPGAGCLAVPITDAEGILAGAVGYSGPSSPVAEPAALARLLRATATRLGPLLT